MTRRLTVILALLAAGCGAVRAASQPPAGAPRPRSTPIYDTGKLVPNASCAPRLEVANPVPLEVTLTRVLATPATAIAIGEGTRIAALADSPYVGDARGLHDLPLPVALRAKPGELDQLGIYFGRDNEPRIMGQRQTQTGETAIYWRHLPNGWRDGREEIGRLGGTTRGALWGVLGSADPELVCRTGVLCIIKRNSGWTQVPAGSSQRLVTLQDGVLWGLDASGIAGIDKQGWVLAIPAPTWSEPKALWASEGEAWVSAKDQLFHYVAGKWQAEPSPVGVVNSLWGARRDSIWIAGNGGAAYFDGHGFRTLKLAGPLYVVRGRTSGEVWFGGEAGLFRIDAPK